jgi:hypothetical protein
MMPSPFVVGLLNKSKQTKQADQAIQRPSTPPFIGLGPLAFRPGIHAELQLFPAITENGEASCNSIPNRAIYNIRFKEIQQKFSYTK